MHFSTLPDARAERAPDAPAIRDDAVALTQRRAARRESQQVAAALADRGIGRGDVVAVLLPNRVELILVLFAAWRLGAVVTPINPVLGPAEARYQVTDAVAEAPRRRDGARRSRRPDSHARCDRARPRRATSPIAEGLDPTTSHCSSTPAARPAAPRASCSPTRTSTR